MILLPSHLFLQAQRTQLIASQHRVTRLVGSVKELTEKVAQPCAYCIDNEYKVLAASDKVAEIERQLVKTTAECAETVREVRDELESATVRHARNAQAGLNKLEEDLRSFFESEMAEIESEILTRANTQLEAAEQVQNTLEVQLETMLARVGGTGMA